MTSLTHSFFTKLANRGYDPLLHNASGTITMNIVDEGTWLINIQQGNLSVQSYDPQLQVDSKILCSKETFERIITGQQNPITAYMRGLLQIEGDVGLLQIFQHLFPYDQSDTSSNKEV